MYINQVIDQRAWRGGLGKGDGAPSALHFFFVRAAVFPRRLFIPVISAWSSDTHLFDGF